MIQIGAIFVSEIFAAYVLFAISALLDTGHDLEMIHTAAEQITHQALKVPTAATDLAVKRSDEARHAGRHN